MFKNKKAISDVISFVLLILLVLISSIITYNFSVKTIDDKKSDYELQKMDMVIKRLNFKLQEIRNFDGGTFVYPIKLEAGTLIVSDNTLRYLSKKEFFGDPYSLDEITYSQSNGFQTIGLTLDNGFFFSRSFSLVPGNYIIKFENIKNESKINILVK